MYSLTSSQPTEGSDIISVAPRKQKHTSTERKSYRYREIFLPLQREILTATDRNFFSGTEIYFKGLEIYFRGFKIYFQAFEIVLLQRERNFCTGRKDILCREKGTSSPTERDFIVYRKTFLCLQMSILPFGITSFHQGRAAGKRLWFREEERGNLTAAPIFR